MFVGKVEEQRGQRLSLASSIINISEIVVESNKRRRRRRRRKKRDEE